MTKQIDYNELTKEELIKELKKVNEELSTTSRLLKKFSTDEILKNYISNDEHIRTIIKIFKATQDTLHKATLKRFATDTKKKLISKNMYENTAHQNNVDKKLYDTMSPNTFDKKIRELKALRLLKEEEGDYSISITDKLATLIKGDKNKTEYQQKNGVRVTRSTKDESELMFESEDKIAAARLKVTRPKEDVTEDIKKFERYKYIYKLNYNTFMIARKLNETEELLKKRIDLVFNQFSNREYLYIVDEKPMYIYRRNKYYQILYNSNYKNLDISLKDLVNTKTIRLKEVEKNMIESEIERGILEHLGHERVIYIHENISTNIENYIKNKMKSHGYRMQFKLIKYRT